MLPPAAANRNFYFFCQRPFISHFFWTHSKMLRCFLLSVTDWCSYFNIQLDDVLSWWFIVWDCQKHISCACVFRSFSGFIRTETGNRDQMSRTQWIWWTQVKNKLIDTLIYQSCCTKTLCFPVPITVPVHAKVCVKVPVPVPVPVPSIRPLLIPLILWESQGGGSQSQLTLGKRWGTS